MLAKPSWNNAPEWARFLAVNANGHWWWYENRPQLQSYMWWPQGGRDCTADEDTVIGFENTLERKP